MATLDNSTNTCRACNAEKPIGEFYLTKGRFGRLYADNTCKACRSAKSQDSKARATIDTAEAERRRIWRREHKRKLRAELGCKPRADIAADAAERAEAKARQRAADKAEKALLRRDANAHVKRWRSVSKALENYREKAKDPAYLAKLAAAKRERYARDPDFRVRQKQYLKVWHKTDAGKLLRRKIESKVRSTPKGKLDRHMSKWIRDCLKGSKAGKSWKQSLGYGVAELMTHLERQFLPGMGWHNRSEWHIDHIRPRASFNYSTPECEDFKACWALSNLQPLWAADNIAKGASLQWAA